MRKENKRRSKLDRENEDCFGISTEQEETTQGPTRFAGKNARRYTDSENENFLIC